jgi:ATP-dependent protease ClpP protease subunit
MEFLRDREQLTRLANRVSVDRSNWFEINAKADDRAEIFVYSDIGWIGATAEDFIAQLKDVTAPDISVRINSMGGSVFDGIAIYNALRSHPAHITTQVDSMAASIASVIAQAGDHRVMVEASEMMIHEATGIALGATESDMRELADLLRNQTEKIAGIYANGKGDGRSKSHFLTLMRAGGSNLGTFLTPQEAVDEGLADEVFSPPTKSRNQSPSPDTETKTPVDFASVFVDDPDEFEWFTPNQET